MQKERNKADGYREKAYEGDTKAISQPSTIARNTDISGIKNRMMKLKLRYSQK